MRIVKVAAMLSGIVVATFVVRQVLGAVSGGRLSWLASPATTVLALLPFAARVGFRRRDTLWLVVPLVGLFWLYRMLWRVASLPERYWEASRDRRSGQPDAFTQASGSPKTLDPSVGQAQPPMGRRDGEESAPPSSGGDLAQLRAGGSDAGRRAETVHRGRPPDEGVDVHRLQAFLGSRTSPFGPHRIAENMRTFHRR